MMRPPARSRARPHAMPTELIRDPREWQRRCAAERAGGRRLALVPTMGFLHDGHLSLMREARRLAGSDGLAPATLFVNPAQFGPAEDLGRYPRDLEGDLAKCERAGIDRVLAPERPDQVYAREHETWVGVERVSRGLCGERRPGHFRGVATVVAKLFNLTRPHVALFGEKDWQQLQVIRAMVRDLDFGVEVVGMPIVREPDGLALSSRNAYLSPDDRRRAPSLHRALLARDPGLVEGDVDYLAVVDADTFLEVGPRPGTLVIGAARFGPTRLIDNIRIED